ncbi:hypothetical protein ACX0G9_03325 [Flavitalea flava]
MKPSNKLLLAFYLFVLGSIGIISLTLYANYKNGNILSGKSLREEQFTTVRMPAPQFISVRGLFQVHLLPSDSFYLEFEKEDGRMKKGKRVVVLKHDDQQEATHQDYRMNGDTLEIGWTNDLKINLPSDDPQYKWAIPVINIHANRINTILLENGQIILEGGKRESTPLFPANLFIRNGVLWIGENYENGNDFIPQNTFYDSLSIKAENSAILLNKYSFISGLHIQLDGKSALYDHGAEIQQPDIDCRKESRINLRPANLKKLQLTVRN